MRNINLWNYKRYFIQPFPILFLRKVNRLDDSTVFLSVERRRVLPLWVGDVLRGSKDEPGIVILSLVLVLGCLSL